MSGEPIDVADLLVLFEAARWAPSSGNSQPWRFVYARRDTDAWPLFFDLLTERNQMWCRNAAALVVVLSRKTSESSGRSLVTHSYDAGAAWLSFALQGWLKGFVVHGMAGFDYARAAAALAVPDDFHVDAMAAVGRPGAAEDLPDVHRVRESPSTRRSLDGTVFEGRFGGTPAARVSG